ncbi:hypothetical protein ACUR5C_00310 [Aliikangiella sp. IMCC44653]
MKISGYIILLLISFGLQGADLKLPTGQEYKEEVFEALSWYNSIILVQRIMSIDCVDTFPSLRKEHAAAFNHTKFLALEKSLNKFMPNPRVEWEARKNDTSFNQPPYKPPSLEKCKKFLNHLPNLINAIETDSTGQVDLVIELATQLGSLSDIELEKVFENLGNKF